MFVMLDNLKRKYDYETDDCYLVFTHQAKPTHKKKIIADWFDYNHGDKVDWLLVRVLEKNNISKYRQIKLENIASIVEIRKKNNAEVITG